MSISLLIKFVAILDKFLVLRQIPFYNGFSDIIYNNSRLTRRGVKIDKSFL